MSDHTSQSDDTSIADGKSRSAIDDAAGSVGASGAADPLGDAVDRLRLDRQLCFALYLASNRMTRLYRHLLEDLGLTYPQYLVLLVLWERSPRSVGELGEALDLDSGTLTPLLKRLEARGLVTRTRDPLDERRVSIALTAEGTALKDRAAGIPAEVACRLAMPEAEAVTLLAELRALGRSLE